MNIKGRDRERLIVLPEIPGTDDGYRIAVKSDVERLRPKKSDVVITYSLKKRKRIKGAKAINIPRVSRSSLFAPKLWKNLIQGRPVHDLSTHELKQVLKAAKPTFQFDQIFCGDVILYNSIRSLFPNAKIDVRFHNLFSLVKARQEKFQYPIGTKFKIVLYTRARLETRILSDPNATPVFITPEDVEYYSNIYPGRKNYKLWEINNLTNSKNIKSEIVKINKLIWFGSLAAHKDFCIKYFIEKIFPALKEQNNKLEFHLYGGGTEIFNAPEKGIKGFGYYQGSGLPDPEGLYINPDLLGGGIKLKLRHLIDNKVSFITTPYGASGYDLNEVANAHVSQIDNWKTDIPKIMNGDSIPKHNFSNLIKFHSPIKEKKIRLRVGINK